jgi:Domain of unknown function (DUF4936)
MRELFVYYRVREVDAAAARAAVLAMHDGLRVSQPGLRVRLLTRSGTGDDGPQTWMETYSLPGQGQGVGSDLEALIETQAAGWAHLVDGPRHIEAFMSS